MINTTPLIMSDLTISMKNMTFRHAVVSRVVSDNHVIVIAPVSIHLRWTTHIKPKFAILGLVHKYIAYYDAEKFAFYTMIKDMGWRVAKLNVFVQPEHASIIHGALKNGARFNVNKLNGIWTLMVYQHKYLYYCTPTEIIRKDVSAYITKETTIVKLYSNSIVVYDRGTNILLCGGLHDTQLITLEGRCKIDFACISDKATIVIVMTDEVTGHAYYTASFVSAPQVCKWQQLESRYVEYFYNDDELFGVSNDHKAYLCTYKSD